jgi:DNA-binding GntR family transcriptional regulator
LLTIASIGAYALRVARNVKTAEADPPADVRQQIRAAILAGEFAPRQRLIEADLCERFDASRFVIRSALQELASQGLIEFQRNRGARVRDVSLTEAIEITEVRTLLEGHVAARAADRVTRKQAAELKDIIKQMRAAVASGELMTYSQLNARLHVRLREISDQAIATQMLEQLRDLTVRHQFTLSLVPGHSSVSLPQHEAIVAAVTAGDAKAAEQAMHVHLQSVISALQALAGASAS